MSSMLGSMRSSTSSEKTMGKKKAIAELEKVRAELRDVRREVQELIERLQAKTTR